MIGATHDLGRNYFKTGLLHGRWFSPGFPASSTTKTGRHDIAEILLKVALKHQKSNQINQSTHLRHLYS
jgi:hypothetical protein